MRGPSGFIWFFIILFIISGFSSLLPLFIIIAVIGAIAYASSQNKSASASNRYQRTYGNTAAAKKDGLSASQTAQVNVFLRNWFNDKTTLAIGSNVELKTHNGQFSTLAALDVYRSGTYICSFGDFKSRYPDSYGEIMNELLAKAQNSPLTQAKSEPEPVKEEKKDAGYFIDEINRLNHNIPDEEITNGLYETTSLLSRIQSLEEKFPNAKNKLSKLYEYYLPIEVRILTQYDNLQAAKTDPSYEKTSQNLLRAIDLINDAMRKIISSMTDEDFINLSADISTLEAVLKKDGLTDDGQITAVRDGGS